MDASVTDRARLVLFNNVVTEIGDTLRKPWPDAHRISVRPEQDSFSLSAIWDEDGGIVWDSTNADPTSDEKIVLGTVEALFMEIAYLQHPKAKEFVSEANSDDII